MEIHSALAQHAFLNPLFYLEKQKTVAYIEQTMKVEEGLQSEVRNVQGKIADLRKVAKL